MIYCFDPKQTITIDNHCYLLEFVKIPINTFPGLSFSVRVEPYDESNKPECVLQFPGSSNTFYYDPCPAFELSISHWKNWFIWEPVVTSSGISVEMLKLKNGRHIFYPLLPLKIECTF